MTAFSTNALIDPTNEPSAIFAMHWLPPSTAVISAQGEIDAVNAAEFTDYALRHTAKAERIAIDLTDVEFFGTAGFSALRAIDVRCMSTDTYWVLVPGKAVNRLLRICDPDSALRTCYSVAAALSALNGKNSLPQLVTKPR